MWPGGVNMISTLKTPASFDDRMISTLSNWVGENWSIERRLPREYCREQVVEVSASASGQTALSPRNTHERLGRVDPGAILGHLAVLLQAPPVPELLAERDD